MTLYGWLYDFWVTYVNPAIPVPDYIEWGLNFTCYIIMLLIILIPIWIMVMVMLLIRSIGGGGRKNDDNW